MAHDTADAPAAARGAVSGVVEQAVRAFGDSLKVAIKAQEDAVKFWSEAVGRAHPGQAVAGEWIPTAQKSAEEYLRLLEASYSRNAQLLRKVMRSQDGGEAADLEDRTSDWLEASMATAGANAQDLASTTLEVAQAWTEVFKKDTKRTSDLAQRAVQQVRRASHAGRRKSARAGA